MNNFKATYKWLNLPVVLCSTAIVSSAAFAVPSTSQEYKDATQTSRLAHEYVGGNTQIGGGISDTGNIDAQINHVFSKSENHSTSGGLWADFDVEGDDKGIDGRGAEINHNWVTRDDSGRAVRVNKAKVAYDRNEAGHERVTLGYGQETDKVFWDGRVSKGLSGRKNTDGNNVSDRGYEYGVGASIGKYLPDSDLRIRGGLDHEWSTKVGEGEDDARNTTLSAGVEKFFRGTGHSVSLDVSGSTRSGGYDDGGSSDDDYSARVGYKYDFAGASAFRPDSTTRRVRVEVPGQATPPKYRTETQYKKVPTYKTVPVYGNKAVKVSYKRMVKSTMALEGQTFFKLNSAKLVPSAQKRLTEVANQIRKSGYKGSIRITGNTCGLGNAKYDQILSEKRAKSVRDFLIKKGFNPDHLLARGLGKSHPKFRNIPGEGFKNRRVDIEYVTERSVAKTEYRTEQRRVQTGSRQVATGFKNVPAGTKNVLIDSGKAGAPRVIWKTETVNNPPAWIQRGLNNNIKHDRTINTYRTREGAAVSVVATNDTANAVCGLPVTIDVLGNDSNNALVVESFTQGNNGTVTQDAAGNLIYTSSGSACGVDDSFTYTVSDGNGNTDTATVIVSVEADDKVEAEDEAVSAVAGEEITIDVLGNDDPDARINSIVTAPGNGSVEIVNGQIVYTPDEGFSGTDTFTYEVIDGSGNTDIAEVTVTIAASTNTAPIAVDDTATTPQGQSVTLDTISNDTDVDGDTLTITNISQPENGTAIFANGQITYVPNAGFVGVEVIDYTISDGNGGTAMATETITVVASNNQAPIATNDSSSVVCSGPVTINVLGNDSDPENATLSIDSFTQPTNGTVTQNANGELIYTSNGNSCGTNDQFTYTISDGVNISNSATVTIAIDPAVNTAPTAVDDSATTQVDTPVTLMTIANDTDPDGDSLTITAVDQPQNGTVTNDGQKITYTPNPGFTGVDVFDYTISDGNGGTAMATETITVTAAPNTAPTAVDDSATTQEGTPVILMTIANDTDPDGDSLTITAVDQPQNGTVTNDGQKITYTPNPGFTGVDVFDYTISDGKGGNAMATETITVTAAPNNAPKAVDDSATTQVDTPITLMTIANDTDVDGDSLTITAVDQPQNGTVTNDGQKITYTPNSGFTGVDVFDYTISDGNGGTSMATETVTVEPAPNKPPVAVDDSATTQEQTPVVLNSVSNDSDPDGDSLTITNVQQPQNGTATTDGQNITYTPAAGFVGTEQFTYTISDSNGGTATATETVIVEAIANKAPIVNLDTASTGCAVITIDVLANDTDPENDTLSIVSVTGANLGTATVVGNQIQYTPGIHCDKVDGSLDSFTYKVSDGTNTTRGNIEVDVLGNEGTLRATSDHAITSVNTPVNINVLLNDSGIGLTIVAVDNPLNGSVSFSNGIIIYTPNPGFVGQDDFYYDIEDQNGDDWSAMVTVDVQP